MSDITIAGATFSDVTKIQIPKSGSGTAEFVEVSGSQEITQNDTYDVSALAQVVVNVSGGGGGGASNIVTGTFKGTEDAEVLEVSVPYNGDGYPILLVIYPSEGAYSSGGEFATLVKERAIATYSAVKSSANTAPTYPASGQTNRDFAVATAVYKGSSSAGGYQDAFARDVAIYKNGDPGTNYAYNTVKIQSKNKIAVKIAGSNTSYGFAKNIDYNYLIAYSS